MGGVAGLCLGLFDWALSDAIGIEFRLGTRDVAPFMFGLFGATYGLMGWMIGQTIMERPAVAGAGGLTVAMGLIVFWLVGRTRADYP